MTPPQNAKPVPSAAQSPAAAARTAPKRFRNVPLRRPRLFQGTFTTLFRGTSATRPVPPRTPAREATRKRTVPRGAGRPCCPCEGSPCGSGCAEGGTSPPSPTPISTSRRGSAWPSSVRAAAASPCSPPRCSGCSPATRRPRGPRSWETSTCSPPTNAPWRVRCGGRRVGLVPQSPAAHLTPVRTVGAQLEETLRELTGTRKQDVREAARAAAGRAAFPADHLDRYPHELSGGLAQRAGGPPSPSSATRPCCSRTSRPPGSTATSSTAPSTSSAGTSTTATCC